MIADAPLWLWIVGTATPAALMWVGFTIADARRHKREWAETLDGWKS